MRHIISDRDVRCLLFEMLERRQLLASLKGVVREDTAGIGRQDRQDSGLPDVFVYLDLNNDGHLGQSEPRTLTSADDLSTLNDESGQFAFEVPPGEYVVRQQLTRPDRSNGEFAPPYFLQTWPHSQEGHGNPLSSSMAQRVRDQQPVAYVLEFTGVIDGLAGDRLPPNWRHLVAGAELSASITYGFEFAPEFEVHPNVGGRRFRVVDDFEVRFSNPGATRGIAESARVDRQATSLTVFDGGQRMLIEVPLMAAPSLFLVVEAQLLPANTSRALPHGGEILPQRMRIVQGDPWFGETIISSTMTVHRWAGKYANRSGQHATLPRDEERSFDFWNTRDDDGDGLPNRWEEPAGGLDVNGDGTIDLSLAARGASPDHQDLFVEVDSMAGRTPARQLVPNWDLVGVTPTGTTLDEVIRSFYIAPVLNPDGESGIRLHIELDETDLPLQSFHRVDQPWYEFDQIASEHAGGNDRRQVDPNRPHVLAARQYVYRYSVFADRRANGSSGLAEVSGNQFFVTLGEWKHLTSDGTVQFGGTPQEQAGTFMHELGHTLGLHHGGDDDFNYKPNYLSVMNYHWQVPSRNEGWTLDYSRNELRPLDPLHLNETHPVSIAPRDEQRAVFVGPDDLRRVHVASPVDWNRDGDAVDTDVAAPIYRGYRHDRRGQGIAFDYYARDGALFDFALQGHLDWQLEPEDYYLADDLEFEDGIHVCDVPEHSVESCYEDTTDFFTLTVSPDTFEPNSNDNPILLPFVDWIAPFDLDLFTGAATGVFSLHNLDDYDPFLWQPPQSIRGQMRIQLTFDPLVLHPPEVLVLDELNHPVGIHRITAGLQSVDLELGELPANGVVRMLVKRRDMAFRPELETPLTVDPMEGLRYVLEIDAPRLESLHGTTWDGTSSSHGQPGDGQSWTDPRNWSVNGVPDVGPVAETAHGFPESVASSQITLATDTTVEMLQFASSQEICDPLCQHSLTVRSGVVDVFPWQVARIYADLTTSGLSISKKGQGTLFLDGQVPELRIYDGSVAGSPTIQGDLWVGRSAVLAPEAFVRVTQQANIAGTITIDVSGESNGVLEADTVRYTPSSALSVRAIEPIGPANSEVRRLVVRAEMVQIGSSDLSSVSRVFGSDRSDSETDRHAGFGVFVKAILSMHEALEVVLFQAGAGDANGDALFNSSDLIAVFQKGLYESEVPAGWFQGDWNHDGRFDSSDLIEAMQLGLYMPDA